MATKEKWVDLFEKVIGRKPSPEEFMAGKAADFDLKSIQSIAGRSQEAAAAEEIQVDIPLEDLAPDAAEADQVTTDSFAGSGQAAQGQVHQAPSAQEVWQAAFTETFKRQPSPEEFQLAQSQGFSAIPIQSELIEKPNPAQPPIKKAKKRLSKKKLVLTALPILLLAGLTAAFFYFRSVTGVKVATEEFAQAVKDKNYDQVASLLSSDKDKWSRSDAKGLLAYLDQQQINIDTELGNIEKSEGKTAFTDENDNKILGVEETTKKFGIFQEYRMVAYPVKVRITTNLDEATIKPNNQETVTLKKGAQTELGDFHFSQHEFLLKGKTEVGPVESKIQLDLDKAKDNQIDLGLKSEKKQLNITMPAEASAASEYKIVVNGKEAGNNLSPEVELIPDQELEVYANFSLNNVSFTTNKAKVVAKGDTIDVELKLSSDAIKRVKEAEAAQKAKEEEQKKQEAKKAQITTFLQNYRKDVFSSISSRGNYYSSYYDTSSAVYKEMVEWTTGGGVKRAKIDYYVAGALDIREVREENGHYVVTTYEDYTVHYVDNTPNSVARKNKVYHLKPVGDSFVIYDIQVSEG